MTGWARIALGMVLLALPLGSAGAAAQRGGTLVYAVIGDPPTYDCHAANSFQALHFLAPHYSLLVKFDPANHPAVIGDLAEGWTVSDDGLTYRFTLLPGIRFHDGSALGARDVKASFDRLRDPPPGVVSAR